MIARILMGYVHFLYISYFKKNAIHFDDIVRVGPAASKTRIPNRKVPYEKVWIQTQPGLAIKNPHQKKP
jgi:hypothetical protein